MKQASKQNITRNTEIKNKLTVARGKEGRALGGGKGKGHQGKCLKDTWTKPKRDRTEGGRWGWDGEWWRENGDNCT